MTDNPKEQAILSIQDRADLKIEEESPLIFYLAQLADEIPIKRGLSRDKALDKFWPTESVLAGAIYSMCAKVAALDFRLKGRTKAVARYANVFQAADFGAGWVNFIQRVVQDILCLAATTRVQLGGDRRGQTKEIRDIVKDRDPGPVLSVDIDGNLIERHVVEWHKTPLGPRRWWWISLKEASGHSREKAGGIFMTEDHPVLTSDGWKLARDIELGDRVATGDPVPNQKQAELLAGSLLGDLCIQPIRKRATLRLCHSVAQEAWLDLKLSALAGFGWTGRATYTSSYQGYSSESVQVASLGSLELERWRQLWYPQGKKVVPRALVESLFSPRLLAAWYCDDGSLCGPRHRTTGESIAPHAVLYTCGFLEDDVRWLVDLLNCKGYSCRLRFQPYRGSDDERDDYPIIYITPKGLQRLVADIGSYVPPELRYKLPKGAPEYDASLWELGRATVYYDTVVASMERDYKAGYKKAKTTFHIGVEETGNFVAANVVVHNTQDNGAFVELLRPKGASPQSPVRGIAHLDSQRIQRTGNPEIPYLYYSNKDSAWHRLRWYQVLALTDQPSPREEDKGRGYCAVSRVLEFAKLLRAVQTYQSQKLSGQRIPALLFVQGMRSNAIADAIEKAREETRASGRSLYITPIVISSHDSQRPLRVQLVELAGLPDGFKYDELMKWYIGVLALGMGTDYIEFFPMPGGNLGSAQQTTEMSSRSRGKGPGLILQQFEFGFNWYVLPSTVEFQFASTDPTAERERVELGVWRARRRGEMVKSGEITGEQALRIAIQEGDAPEDFISGGDGAAEDRVDMLVKSLQDIKNSYNKVESILGRLR